MILECKKQIFGHKYRHTHSPSSPIFFNKKHWYYHQAFILQAMTFLPLARFSQPNHIFETHFILRLLLPAFYHQKMMITKVQGLFLNEKWVFLKVNSLVLSSSFYPQGPHSGRQSSHSFGNLAAGVHPPGLRRAGGIRLHLEASDQPHEASTPAAAQSHARNRRRRGRGHDFRGRGHRKCPAPLKHRHAPRLHGTGGLRAECRFDLQQLDRRRRGRERRRKWAWQPSQQREQRGGVGVA